MVSDVSSKVNIFANAIVDKAFSSSTQNNFICSPLSIFLALAAISHGAGSTTAQEFTEILGFDPTESQLFLQELKEQLEKLKCVDDSAQTRLETSVWVQEGFVIKPSFLTTLAELYSASSKIVDFKENPLAAVREINAWASQATAGKIDNIVNVQTITVYTKLILASVAYFKAAWRNAFSSARTKMRPFYALDGSVSAVPTMHQRETFEVAETADWKAIDLPYAAGTLTLTLVVPTDFSKPVELLQVVNALNYTSVDLALPKFTIQSDTSLKEHLQVLGVSKAFSLDADFSNLSDGPLFVDKIAHKALITVDEKGTEAAAVTTVSIARAAFREPDSVPFVVDRPFKFWLRDPETNLIVFTGQVTKL